MRAANAEHVARCAPLLRDLQLASRTLFGELAQGANNDFGLVQRGLLLLCKTQHALDEEAKTAERTRALDVPAEIISRQRAAELDPGVTMEVAGGIYFPLDCHLTPQRFMATMDRLVRESSATLLWSTEITDWKASDGKITAAVTSRGEVRGDEFVIAGGSWSPAIARPLGLKLPLQPGKGYSLTLSQPRRLPQLCSILAEAHVAVTPMGSTLRVGGTMELSGINHAIRPERVQGIVEAVTRYLPEFRAEDFRAVSPWHGLRPVSPDGMPYVGRFRGYENLSTATGHAMMGLSLAPITGRLIAEIISNEKPSHPLALLNPDRYS
jgi:D-amino-acid dehydrogenase